MGFTGLARWINAPTNGFELINDNIIRNHGGTPRGKWMLTVKSYRPIPVQNGSEGHVLPDRTMCAVTMNENAFVLIDDPVAPTRAEILAAAAENPLANQQTSDSVDVYPPHYRTTYVTVNPPQSLELLLTQLRAQWQSARQLAGQHRGQSNLGTTSVQLSVEGSVFAIGTDWLVRVGNVVLAGGTVRGMLLEAEYLPLHAMPVQSADGTSELLSNLLTSLLPRLSDARTVAVTIPPGQWDEVLYSGDSSIEETNPTNGNSDLEDDEEVLDGVYIHGVPPSRSKQGDWQGIDRDRRAAFLIIGALKAEGLL
ncbi:hypothetical protein BU17DRAFT_80189 [Hysterangium stoloniferum]|nr:hypothetical protein BU17DRAFT_80189 [Hysterangium stoloniferum]